MVVRNLLSCIVRSNKPFLPAHLQIEPSNKCNLKCVMCPRNEHIFKEGNMKLEQFKKIINENKQLKQITLSGYGEPTINLALEDMIKYAKSKKINVEIITNGTLLNEEKVKSLLQTGLDRIYLSVDSAEPITYKKIRGVNFSLVKKAGELINEQKKALKRKKPFLVINCVVMKDNVNDLFKVVDFAKTMDASVNFKSLRSSEPGFFDFLEHFNFVRKYAKKLGVKVVESNKTGDELVCYRLWLSGFVTWDGELTPCCEFSDELSFGNVFSAKFSDVWLGVEAEKFRDWTSRGFSKGFYSDKVFGVCENCNLVFNDKLHKFLRQGK